MEEEVQIENSDALAEKRFIKLTKDRIKYFLNEMNTSLKKLPNEKELKNHQNYDV